MSRHAAGPRAPDFVCIGPKKTATTWLADHLKMHCDIWLTPIQELNYLNGAFAQHRGKPHARLRWTRWEVLKRLVRNKGLSPAADRRFFAAAEAAAADSAFDLDRYLELFAPAGRRLTGDISPMYASLGADEITRALPVLADARVFMLARDPVQRFWSELSMHARKRTFGDVDYGSATMVERFWADPERQKQHRMSRIALRWRAGIGDRLGIFYFDDIAADGEASLRRIVAFIGADYAKRFPFVSPTRNRKAGRTRLDPSPDALTFVRDAFQEELRACEEVFGGHGRAWRNRYRA